MKIFHPLAFYYKHATNSQADIFASSQAMVWSPHKIASSYTVAVRVHTVCTVIMHRMWNVMFIQCKNVPCINAST